MYNKESNKNLLIFNIIFISICLFLLLRVWQLQIIDHKTYLRLAQINAARTLPLIAPRGVIYDRNGKILVYNKASFSVYILQSELKNKGYVFSKISKELSIPYGEIVQKIKKNRFTPFNPILIKDDVELEIIAKLKEQLSQLPGVLINTRPIRIYPHKYLAAHVLGYVGEVNASDLSNSSLNISAGDLIGKTGIEKVYDAYLRGINGGERVQIDTFGKAKGIARFENSIPGKNLFLTIDLDMQKAADEALGQNKGAVVVLDPKSGSILALASHPSYDPNIFAHPISQSTWKNLHSLGHPFLNRALSVYPPGSTFKVVTLAQALDNNLSNKNEMFFCPGFFSLGKRIAKCWKTVGHKSLDLLEGLVQSCDIVFYNLGLRSDPDLISSYAKQFGLGKKTGIDLPAEAAGIVPSTSWKERVYSEKWYPGDSINFAIGQGFLWVTPLQMANLYASIANEKERYVPHIISEIKDRNGQTVFSYLPRIIGNMPVKEESLGLVKKALYDVVVRGTGRAAYIPSFEAAGKTGTAENPRKPPHAWFVCYAPHDSPEIVISAFVEHGMHGDQVTAKIARYILEKYWEKKQAMLKST